MRLIDLTIRGFGKLHDKKIDFDSGLNVLYGGNEAGKSTVHSFLRAMLYGMERARGRAAKTDFYSHYEPWFGDGAYGGTLRLEFEGRTYRLERNFSKNPRNLTIVDETEGTELADPEPLMNRIRDGLSETAFMNTISIGQLKSATDSGMVNELKNYIANMNTSGNMALNITKAEACLRDRRKSLEKHIVPDAAKNYAADLSDIRRIEAEIASPVYENRINALNAEAGVIRKEEDLLQADRGECIRRCTEGTSLLNHAGFADRAAILEAKANARRAYDTLSAAKETAKDSEGMKHAAILLLIAAALAAIGAILVGTGNAPGLAAVLPGAPVSAVAFTMFLLAAALLAGGLYLLRESDTRSRLLSEAADAFTAALRLDKAALADAEAFLTEHPGTGSFSPDPVRSVSPDGISEEVPGEGIDAARLETYYESLDGLLALTDRISEDKNALQRIGRSLDLLDERRHAQENGMEKQRKTQWELERKIEHLSELKDECAALKNVVDENDRIRFEIEAIEIASETMNRLAVSIRDSFGLYLNHRTSDLLEGITGGIYTSLSIDQDLNVSLNTREKLIPLSSVSSGAMDQVYLALRLAAAELMTSDSEPLPLFFDDSFVNYDEKRLETVLQWLGKEYKRQSLIFTCHRREAKILTELGLGFRLTEI